MRQLVLVGGGHAHVQVLKRLAMRPEPGVRVTLVLDRPEAVYSGMVPGFVAGQYTEAELTIDVRPLARRAGASVVVAAATGIDPETRRIELSGRPSLHFDVASLDVGSAVRACDSAGGSMANVVATRPIGRFVKRLQGMLERAKGRSGTHVAVVGAGAGGVELAFAIHARLSRDGAPGVKVTLVDGGGVLRGVAKRVRARVTKRLSERGILLQTSAAVTAVEAAGQDAKDVVFSDGTTLECHEVIWAAGATALPWLAAAPLPHDDGGFVRVRPTLQVLGHDHLFAVGDCASFEPQLPKAGVYAVRQGPVLEHNLRAQLRATGQGDAVAGALEDYRPQRDFLALLNLADGTAIGTKASVLLEGRAVFRLKDWIDRRFVRRFQVLNAKGALTDDFPAMVEMADAPCGGCAAKVGISPLSRALARVGVQSDASVILGLTEADDVAAVGMDNGSLVVASVDAFRAFTDDPWLVGRVAAVNAASDLWAKGVAPRFAMAQVTVAESEPLLAEEMLFQVLAGARVAFDADRITLVGGHSIAGSDLTVGFAVWGEAPSAKTLLQSAGLCVGDRLILTKALGTGLLWRADMLGQARGQWMEAAAKSMCRSNESAASVARDVGARGCTDVTGFGLAGHLSALLRSSQVSARVQVGSLPALPGATDCLAQGLRSTFHQQNARAGRAHRVSAEAAAHPALDLIFDPQTSGGLVFGVPEARTYEALERLREGGDDDACVIGEVTALADGPPELCISR